MRSSVFLFALFAGLLILPLGASAQAVSEVMYDLDGSDTGHEWVEIYNNSGSAIDLTSFRFFEADTNHKINEYQGGATLAPGAYAVIADNAATFLGDHAGFGGVLFDSSFSLSNTGETLTLRASDLSDVDSVAYTPDWGAAGNGNSLQKAGASWIEAPPTPGAENATSPAPAEEAQVEEGLPGEETTTSKTQTGTQSSFPVEPQIFARIAAVPKPATAGASGVFGGEAFGAEGERIQNARYLWTFGDGARGEGERITHTYHFPGEYVVLLTVSSEEYSATARAIVSARAAAVSVSGVTPGPDGFVELFNNDTEELELSNWALALGGVIFRFPEGTFILPGHRIRFPSEVMDVSVSDPAAVALLFPNGARAAAYESGAGAPVAFAPKAPAPAKTAPPVALTSTPTADPQPSQTIKTPRSADETLLAAGILEEGEAVRPDVSRSNLIVPSAEAAAGTSISSPAKGRGLIPWLLTLGGLIVTALVALVFAPEEVPADTYAIIEDVTDE